MLEASVYVAFCLLTALYGFDRRMGFIGTFLVSIVLTPVAVMVVLLLTAPKHRHLSDWSSQIRRPSSPQGH
jgi:hypothetical protein